MSFTPVPEPSTLLLLALSAMGWAGIRALRARRATIQRLTKSLQPDCLVVVHTPRPTHSREIKETVARGANYINFLDSLNWKLRRHPAGGGSKVDLLTRSAFRMGLGTSGGHVEIGFRVARNDE